MTPDGLYDLLIDAATAPQWEALAAQGWATLEGVEKGDRRRLLLEAVQRILPELLAERLGVCTPDERTAAELALCNALLAAVRRSPEGDQWRDPLRVLRSVHRAHPPFEAPQIPLSLPWLFTAGQGDPSLLSELRKEMASADQVDMLMSFITWSGVRRILDVLEALTAPGADGRPRTRIRILTTTYTGATEYRAVEALALLPGVEVRISLDGRRTRLHAKAWVLHRQTGFGTAFVGSANLTGAALMGGLEWTVRFTQSGQGDLYAAAQAHFETLWNDPEFQPFDPRNAAHGAQLRQALRTEGSLGTPCATRTWFEIQPKAYQQEMLDRLAAERRHGRTRNLLVAATGTGKTVVAAFDYLNRCRETGGKPRLLFVAHRKEILLQARETYRQVIKDSDFGELLADGSAPSAFDHLFATIQSIEARGLLERLGPDHWNVVVLDECHHITATSFDRFARAIQPAILLGLTATPERADGASIAPYFHMRPDGAPAVELRLWEALDQQLLAPFEYYGVTDETDFSRVRWNQAGELADLGQILTGNHIRARLIIESFERYAADPRTATVLGFCVSVAHAQFMAEQFNRAGHPALAITGGTDPEVRARIPGMLTRREITAVFTCDLYNEGVDLPDVNTLLLLRPTQSPVLFQQQIGRGLRLAPGKATCLILDFVGRHREEFRFDILLQPLTGLPRRRLVQEVEEGFPTLPPGCLIRFDRVPRERVLESLRRIANQNWRHLAAELRSYLANPVHRNPSLSAFLHDTGIPLTDLYRASIPAGWTGLRRAAGMELGPAGPQEPWLGRRFGDLLHADDPEYLGLWQRLREPGFEFQSLGPLDQRRVQMLAYQVYPSSQDAFTAEEFLRRLGNHSRMREELGELGAWLESSSDLEPLPLPGAPASWPLRLHAAYGIREILTAVGWLEQGRRAPFQAGVLPRHDEKIELLFVTLDKREGYHAGIAYHDYAISPELFHWQTQNAAGPDTAAGKRYLESGKNGWQFQLFVRLNKDAPYRALGPVSLIRAQGNRPMSLTWKLEVPLPPSLWMAYRVLRAT